MKLSDMKISTRLMLGFAAMAVLMSLLGALAIIKVTAIQGKFADVMDDRYPKIQTAGDIRTVNNEVSLAIRNLFVVSEPADVQAQFDVIANSSKRTNANIDTLQRSITSAQGKAALDKLMAARADYRGPRDKVLELLRAGQMDEAKLVLVREVTPKQVAYMARLDELIQLQENLMTASADEVSAAVSSTISSVAALLAAAFVVAGLMALWIIRSTTRPLAEAAAIARAVAGGDLAMEFAANGKNETGLLLAALHDMKTRLAAIVSEVRRNAEGVATASAQIAQGNNDLSSRTEEQASALEETAASMEELSSTVKQNADNAQQGNQLALGASTVAVKGGDVVGQVVDTMKGINDSSKKIADIIGVIDSIAFQTNILALNAAVEAARAGEQGRGFAVVASEVRNLAQRSADAAKEIKGLINASVQRVEQGSALVDQAGVTMSEVVSSIRRVTDIMGEISSASREQSAGVAQVGEAVTQMDQATQQNAALVEESAAAAESLKAQAQQLVQAVAVFKLAHDAAASTAAQGSSSRAPLALPAPTPAKPPKAAAAPMIERRSPNRATNVVRPAFQAKAPSSTTAEAAAARSGTDDWESF
ncbi:methyl-accepting chemotaxis protein [Methylibium petroleiphilum]|uniref:Methyl-accepting chemotaxis sensory transducer n=1 Tax=Methylibium petroleiphilum (strain ATCC BAA-1232 / LMG 22953 / PM1) TaxID=420662 RepID=A2SDS3_METPP|nr:methyl-accepting chemotaxis protein [Methylibium petroleiphilum]ABM93712.1 methyl-accepting chemotaxis sensory transducer [Methylibium petroleiphilum PM1]